VGEVFAGRYELVEPVAMGGMGTVWLVVDRSDHQLKAAKILRQSDAASLLRFVREQSMRIDHSHVVTPQSWAGMDDRVLFTMPLVRGGSVAGLLSQFGALPVRWVALLLEQTLQALEAVHAAGIVHRDVKPANLLLEPTGHAMPHLRLTDFGIAAPLNEPRMTHASIVIGTPGYMAPEQARGAEPDPRADLYATGIVGLEMLTGRRPRADDVLDLDALRTDDPARNQLLDLLATATATDPEKRAPSAARLRADLEALGLTSLPPEPDEAVIVADQFAEHAPVSTAPQPATEPAGAGRTLSGAPTRVDRPSAPDGSTMVQHGPPGAGFGVPARTPARSALPGVLLLVVGLLSLLASLLLWFG